MNKCKACGHPVEPFMSFGQMPIANGFLSQTEFPDEFFAELAVGFCEDCALVQLTQTVDRERMFHDNYAFFSSTSSRMALHFERFATEVRASYIDEASAFVVELGSNDGIMLRHFSAAGVKHLGIEPSANVAEAARASGVRTLCRFFDEDLAKEIVEENGQADAVLGANVMCHLPYLHSVAAGIRILLKPHGVLIFEDPYLGDIMEKTSYDQIYDEHAFYFSLASVRNLFEGHGLDLIDAIPQDVHGGSMRYVLAHRGMRRESPRLAMLQAREDRLGLRVPETFRRFRSKVERSRDDLMALLLKLSESNSRVVGYGATSKSTTVTNYCGITPKLVEFISDTTPGKQGKFSPGTHIPVRPHSEFTARYPAYALLFAWNHNEEIMEKEQAFRSAGGQWIVYVPEVRIL